MTPRPTSSLRATARRSAAEFAVALAVSLALHGAVAVFATGRTLSAARLPDKPVALDVSHIAFSTAAREDAAAPVSVAPPVPAVVPPPRPKVSERPPDAPPVPLGALPSAALPSQVLSAPTVEVRFEMPPESVTEIAASENSEAAGEADRAAEAAPVQAAVEAPPRPRRKIRPKYPDERRRRGEEGDVTLIVVVGEDGNVTEAAVERTSGFADFDAAAVKAVRSARFSPAESAGRPVVAPVRLTVSFRLRSS